MINMSDAVPFTEALDLNRFGGKSVQLGAALRAGLPVPPGHALSVALVDRLMAGDGEAKAQVEHLFTGLSSACAVRSSAVGEDGANASFAGQHATILNVRSSPELIPAIAAVWRSGRSESALAYRRKIGIIGEPRVAVALQRLIEPESAGVLFTRNPITGADERVIEATWGLGEAVVAGLVTPDHFRVGCDGEILERIIGNKDLEIKADPAGGTRELAVDDARASACCLTDGQLAKLHELASRCQRAFGTALDLEWAFAGGELYLLQSRAITAS